MSSESLSLQSFEERLVALRPRACGCVHELDSSVKGKVVFCPLMKRSSNSACFHKPDEHVLTELLHFAHRYQLISGDEFDRFYESLAQSEKFLGYIDAEAQLRAEECEDLYGIERDIPLSGHPITQDIKERQRPHVETHQDIIDLLRERLKIHKAGHHIWR